MKIEDLVHALWTGRLTQLAYAEKLPFVLVWDGKSHIAVDAGRVLLRMNVGEWPGFRVCSPTLWTIRPSDGTVFRTAMHGNVPVALEDKKYWLVDPTAYNAYLISH